MNQTIKALIAIAATTVLANCSGSQDLSDLPVRDSPQRISPVTIVTPDAAVLVVDA